MAICLFNISFYHVLTPVPSNVPPEIFKIRFYFVLAGALIVLGLGINAFLLMKKKDSTLV
jgi:hypothetical protein